MTRDAYDPIVAFDDVLGGYGAEKKPVIIDMAGATLRALKKRRLKPLPQRLVGADFDSSEWSFDVPYKKAIGADKKVEEGQHPLFDTLRKRFSNAVGSPKLLRIDGEESYADFRDRRRQVHLDELDARLAKLEQAFAAHVSGHAVDDAWLRYDSEQAPFDYEYQRQVVGVVSEAARGGKLVPLGLPPRMRGKVECWLDGDEVVISVRMPAGIATTGTPLQPEFEDVVGCAEAVGCDGESAIMLGLQLAPVTAGRRLLGDVCRAAAVLGDEPTPSVMVLRPTTDPGLAAAMALLQRCQQRDRQACREASAMMHGSGTTLIEKASEILTAAQAAKASRPPRNTSTSQSYGGGSNQPAGGGQNSDDGVDNDYSPGGRPPGGTSGDDLRNINRHFKQFT